MVKIRIGGFGRLKAVRAGIGEEVYCVEMDLYFGLGDELQGDAYARKHAQRMVSVSCPVTR